MDGGKHPYMGAAIAIVLCLLVVLVVRRAIRALRALFAGAENELADTTSSS